MKNFIQQGTEQWYVALEKFLINFGSLELITYAWINTLVKDDMLYSLAFDMPLSKRIKLLKELIDRESIPQNIKNKSSKLWDEVADILILRNSAVHSPLILRWKGPEGKRHPDFIGLPNLKKLKKKKMDVKPFINLKK